MTSTASERRAQELRQIVGDPATVARGIQRLRASAEVLSSDQPRFIEEYPEKWVAVFNHDVIARDSLDGVLEALDERGVPRENAIVRFIDRSERTLFL